MLRDFCVRSLRLGYFLRSNRHCCLAPHISNLAFYRCTACLPNMSTAAASLHTGGTGVHAREASVARNIPAAGRRTVENLTTTTEAVVEVDKPVDVAESIKPGFTVKSVDLKIDANRTAHRTSEYEVTNLIVRRGQPFEVIVEFDGPIKLDDASMNFEVHLGEKPNLMKNTLIRIPLGSDDRDIKWKVKVLKQSGGTLLLAIHPPPTSIVGRCFFAISTNPKTEGSKIDQLWQSKPVYILFNPWCEDDTVYLDDEAERDEYVLNDTGMLYVGSSLNSSGRPWNFAQFEDESFEASIYLLEEALAVQSRGNPIQVTRRISALVNAMDDNGVLRGNWSGNYYGGTAPSAWAGSLAILKQYFETKEPVNYGQCWVFSGVTTTVLRCLGIPTRSVTNFSSAHDTDGSMTIDSYFTTRFRRISDLNEDSIWNFHVWNECWMARPDLPTGYGGWQAVDGTPQETSEGAYQTGPASVMAVKQGYVYYNYDTQFVFAEVSADKIAWVAKVDFEGNIIDRSKLMLQRDSVGKKILTKAVGSDEAEDIVGQYKFPENSPEERMAIELAVSHGSKPDTYITDKTIKLDVHCAISVKNKVTIGEDFDIEIDMTNKSSKKCTVGTLYVTCYICHYTGVVVQECKDVKIENVVIEANSAAKSTVHISNIDYEDLLHEHATMKIYAMGQLVENNDTIAAQEDFSLTPPSLAIKLQEESAKLRIGGEFSITITFDNPMGKSMTDVNFILEGLGIQKTKTIPHGDIAPKETGRVEVKLTPKKSGKRKLVATLHCQELQGVTGSLEVNVSPAVTADKDKDTSA